MSSIWLADTSIVRVIEFGLSMTFTQTPAGPNFSETTVLPSTRLRLTASISISVTWRLIYEDFNTD